MKNIIIIIALIALCVLFSEQIEGFHGRRYASPFVYRNYYPQWWPYWMYPYWMYIPRKVDLPFEGNNGYSSWYSPYSGIIHNY